MCSPTIRAVRSSVPPAANGTIIVIGREGRVCALAIREKGGTAAAPAARCRKVLRGSFMALPLRLGLRHRGTRDGGKSSGTPLQDGEIDGAAGVWRSCAIAARQPHRKHRALARLA